jgi:hypothetical protein
MRIRFCGNVFTEPLLRNVAVESLALLLRAEATPDSTLVPKTGHPDGLFS